MNSRLRISILNESRRVMTRPGVLYGVDAPPPSLTTTRFPIDHPNHALLCRVPRALSARPSSDQSSVMLAEGE